MTLGLEVENGISAQLAADYDWIDTNYNRNN